MSETIYIFLGAIIGAIAAYITAKMTIKNQIKIAELNARKDIELQNLKIYDERLRNEVSIERDKLEKLHAILSFIALEYSQTKSIVESSSNISVDHLHERYFKNCERLHEAQAIAALYYPDVSGALDEIYGQSNIFWGNQERVLQTDINKDQDLWDKHFTEVLSAINKISKDVKSVQYSIRHRATYISKSIKQIQ